MMCERSHIDERAGRDFLEAAMQDLSLLSAVGDNPYVAEMEKAVAEFHRLPERSVLAVNSATAGLIAALTALGIGRGDEVITSAYGWGQTLAAIIAVGATPVLVDTAPDSPNLDLKLAVRTISPRTRAILVSELFGIPIDRARLAAIKARFGINTIVDAAQSFAASVPAPWPDAVVFSFGRAKLIVGGEGGAIATTDRDLFDILCVLTQHPVRALQLASAAILPQLIDSIAPHCRIHPFAASLITAGIRSLAEVRETVTERVSTIRHHLNHAGFELPDLPKHCTQSAMPVPVLVGRNLVNALDECCRQEGLSLTRCERAPLSESATVKNRTFIPAAIGRGSAKRRLNVQLANPPFPAAKKLGRNLYLVSDQET